MWFTIICCLAKNEHATKTIVKGGLEMKMNHVLYVHKLILVVRIKGFEFNSRFDF